MESLETRFQSYFSRPVAEQAAKSLSNGVEIELRIGRQGETPAETLTFAREGGKNRVRAGTASSPDVVFTLTPAAALEVLADTSEDIGAIGVRIGKLIVSRDPERRVWIRLQAGFFTLFTRGYLGVLTAGGASFASFLASHGLQGMGAVKTAIKKMKGA